MATLQFITPVTGTLLPVNQVPDPVFAEEMLGTGFAIKTIIASGGVSLMLYYMPYLYSISTISTAFAVPATTRSPFRSPAPMPTTTSRFRGWRISRRCIWPAPST